MVGGFILARGQGLEPVVPTLLRKPGLLETLRFQTSTTGKLPFPRLLSPVRIQNFKQRKNRKLNKKAYGLFFGSGTGTRTPVLRTRT